MKINYKRILRAAICVALCVVFLAGVWVSAAAESSVSADPFDYSLGTLESKQSISASDLFYRIYGEYPTDEERIYLDELSGITLRYTDLIPQSIVSIDYNGEIGVLQVTVLPYQYTASNGAVVEWIPETATLEGVKKSLTKSGEEYVCRFENLLYSQDFDVYVSFVWNAELPAETVDQLLTKAYTDGSEALDRILSYEEDCVKPYFEAVKRFEEYQEYESAMTVYNAYLAELAIYEGKLEAYQAYLAACEQYPKDVIAYEAYLQNKALWDAYYVYQDFKKNDLEKYNEYLLYQSTVNKILSKLAVLESLFVADSHSWTFYPSLMGNLVTSVTSRKEELISAGCNAKDINNADSATMALRRLLTGYSELRKQTYASEHEKITALYTYYTEHYTELREQFALLYGSLIALYGNEFVVIYADSKGKLDHFQQFIGQLYVTTTCLDDTDQGMRMENWKISGLRLSDVVEAVNLIPDTGNSDPKGTRMPEKEAERVDPIAPVEKPSVLLPAMSKPVMPTPVEEPSKPFPMEKPEEVPAVEHPGEMPSEPSMDERLRNLAIAIREGRVPQREAEGVSRNIILKKTIVCPISIHNLKTVTFYDIDGETILYQQKVNYGESVTYGGPSTDKIDPYYVYSFRGWVFSDGSAATFDEVFENLSVFADYKKEPRLYKVLWILDGAETETYHCYGEIPTPPFPLNKPDGVGVTYHFTGWDKEVTAVDGEAVYVGGFDARPKVYTVTWKTHDMQFTQAVTHGELSSFSKNDPYYWDQLYYYAFAGWDKDLNLPITGDITFEAQYSKIPWATTLSGEELEIVQDEQTITIPAESSGVVLRAALSYAKEKGLSLLIRCQEFNIGYGNQGVQELIDSNCARITLRQRQESSLNGVYYTIAYQDEQGNDVNAQISASLMLYPLNEDGLGFVYSVHDGNGWRELREDSHAVSGVTKLLVKRAYRIAVEGNENCNISALPLFAVSGDWISIDIACDFGYEILGAILKLEGQEPIEVKGKRFQMPQGDVSITLNVEKIIYHVTFLVDGKIYCEADYSLGEEIRLPDPPAKAQDSTYSYEFLEWSPTVTIAMGEDRTPTYTAVFSKTLLNGVDPYHSGNNNNALLNTYLPIALCVLTVVIGLLIFLRNRKKRRLAATAMEDETADDSKA